MKYPLIIHDRQRCKGNTYLQYYWCSRFWTVGVRLECPSDVIYWWKFWRSDTVDLSWTGKMIRFFQYALWPPVGISWEIRKRAGSEYYIGSLFGFIEIDFTQK